TSASNLHQPLGSGAQVSTSDRRTLSSSLHQRHESEVDTDPTRAQVPTSDLPSPNSTLSTIELPPMEPNPHLGTTTNSFISPSQGKRASLNRLPHTPPLRHTESKRPTIR
ncbi:hypothetical protein ADUPG1_005238, partial [Aduncisulcus paluster]